MADQFPSFEQALEADIQTLAAEIVKNKEQHEISQAEGLDVVKDAIRAFPQLQNTSTTPAVPTPPANQHSPLPEYAEHASPETKLEIEYLLDLALKQGVGKALAEAGKSPYFVQDAFHDALAGKLYPELQRRGIVH